MGLRKNCWGLSATMHGPQWKIRSRACLNPMKLHALGCSTTTIQALQQFTDMLHPSNTFCEDATGATLIECSDENKGPFRQNCGELFAEKINTFCSECDAPST